MENEQKHEGKRPWTRRTHKPLERTPSDLWKPELIEGFKTRGQEPVTPMDALRAFGLKVQEDQEAFLNSALLQTDNQIFFHTDGHITFPSDRIEAFIAIAQGASFQIFEIADLPLEVKEHTLRNPSAIILSLLEEQRTKEEERIKKRTKDWQK